MVEPTRKLKSEDWLRRLDQAFELELDTNATQTLSQYLNIPIVRIGACLHAIQPYDHRLLTFRGTYEIRMTRECVVSLELFEETLCGDFERSYCLSPNAPSVPEGAEEAEEFPFDGLCLMDMLSDELALNITPFPRKPDAVVLRPTERMAPALAERLHPFAELQKLYGTLSS